jgi:hypothetical protein
MYNGFCDSLGKGKNFQLITPFTVWNWPPANVGQTGSAQYSFLDAMPVFDPIGNYQSGSSFSQSYQQWLNTLVVAADSNLQNRITIQAGVLQTASNKYQMDYQSAQTAYQNDKTVVNNNPDFNTWLGQGGFGYQATIAADRANILEQQKIYNQLVNQAADPVIDSAQAAMANQSYYTNVLSSSSPTPYPMPGYGQVTSFSDWLTQVAGSGPQQITWQNDRSSSSFNSSWAKGQASYGNWLFSVFVKGSWQRLLSVESSSAVSVTMTFNPLGSIPVGPNPWYQEGVIRAKVNNPAAYRSGYSPTRPASGQGGWALGAGGILPCRMTDFIVGYQPSFIINCSAGFSSVDYQAIQVATGVRIGPFVFGGDGGNTTSYTQSALTTSSFSGKSTSQFPVLIGIYVEDFSTLS